MEVPSSPYKMFYLVERGECWLDGDFTDAPICLQAGDMLTFPHGDYHCLSTTREHILPLPYTTILEAQQMGQLPDTHEPCATLVWGHMLQRAFGYHAPMFPGSQWIPAVFGMAVFAYGGWPFLQGARRELTDRLPGMMTLIALAISVAFVFSAAVALTGP